MKNIIADYAVLGVDEIVAIPEQGDAGVFLTLRLVKNDAAQPSNTPETDPTRKVVVMSHRTMMDLLSVLNQARRNLGIAEDDPAEAQGIVVPPEGSKH